MANFLLKDVKKDTAGPETPMRVLGNREVPGKIALQIVLEGAATVHIQGRLAKEAPWLDICPPLQASALLNIDPVPLLRAVSAGMGADATVSVLVTWGW